MSEKVDHRKSRRRAAAMALAGAMVLELAACGSDGSSAIPQSPPTSSASSTPTAVPSGPGGATVTASPRPATARPATPHPATHHPATPHRATTRSAAAQLAPFLDGARRADNQLHHAAALINAGITTDAVRISPDMVQAVKAISPAALARTIPAGANPHLLRPVLLVYSDIVARRMAMEPIIHAGAGEVVLPRPGPEDTSPSAQEILDALRNGARAQARFEADLTAARAAARSAPRFTIAHVSSRAAAELAVRLAYIDVANGGCAGTGGEIFPQLAQLTWSEGKAGHWWSGTVNDIQFRAENRGTWWRVSLNAC